MTVTHEAKLSQLQQRISEIDAGIVVIDRQFEQLAGGFTVRDEHQLKQAALLEERGNRLRRERAVCLAAAGQVEQQRQRELQEQEQAAAQKRQLQAKQLADQIMAANIELDRLLVGLREAFERRIVLLRALAATDVVQDTLTNRMMGKGPATAAACHAGLYRHIDIVSVATVSVRPLADGNRALLGIAAEPARRPLQNGGGA
jgi:hypothetical protein